MSRPLSLMLIVVGGLGGLSCATRMPRDEGLPFCRLLFVSYLDTRISGFLHFARAGCEKSG